MGKTKKKNLIKDSYKANLDDEQFNVKRLIIISIVVLAFVGIIYFITAKFVVKDNKKEDNTTEVDINYDIVTVGTMLNRSYDSYYVLVYSSEDIDAPLYNSVISKYSTTENAKKVFSCDLESALNSNYKSETEFGNTNAKTIDEFSFGKVSLLYINGGKVSKYIEGIDNIKKELNN